MTDVAARLAAALADHYSIERELGHGGMVTVHLARDLKHGRTVAIKVLRPELAQAVGDARFLREINIAAQLQSPHILPLLDSGEADGLLYKVMATAQEPFFKRLGTPAADKKYILYEGGHDVPRTQLIKESLALLDKYLGPVK